jgi:hypothetical protein
MTAINESGQMYWTFEDLDYSFVLDEILNEKSSINELASSISTVMNAMFTRDHNGKVQFTHLYNHDYWQVLNKEWNKLDARRQVLITVFDYISNLRSGVNFID